MGGNNPSELRARPQAALVPEPILGAGNWRSAIYSTPLPEALREQLQKELAPGESVRWSARPDPKRMMRAGWAGTAFGVLWTSFSLFCVWGAAGFGQPDRLEGPMILFPLFGVPFVLIGFAMLASPWILRRQALSSVYAITDRRAIVIEGGFGLTVRSVQPSGLEHLDREQFPDGSGDIIFATEFVRTRNGHTRQIGFFGVPDARNVQSLLRGLHESAVRAAS